MTDTAHAHELMDAKLIENLPILPQLKSIIESVDYTNQPAKISIEDLGTIVRKLERAYSVIGEMAVHETKRTF